MIHYYNGKYLEESEIKIAAFTDVFKFGAGIFTTLKFSGSQFHFLPAHLERLKSSLQYYGYVFPEIDYEDILKHLVKMNNLEEARIKIMIFDEDRSISVLIKIMELSVNNEAKKLTLFPEKRPDHQRYRYKSMNYFENIHNNRQAKKMAYDDYIYIDEQDRILETSFSNIFFLKGRTLYTPASYLPILPGIIRQEILNKTSFNAYSVEEKDIYLNNYYEFDAAFLTNSIQGVVPIHSIDDKIFLTEIIKKYLLATNFYSNSD